MSKDKFEEIEHTADWALRIRGQDLTEVLVNAARGMSSLLVQELAEIPLEVERHFELEGADAGRIRSGHREPATILSSKHWIGLR